VKRLLVFAGYFYPHIGGSEIAIYELCRRLVNKGYEIDVVTCNTEKAPIIEKLEGFSVYRLPSWNILNNMYPLPKPTLTTLKILLKLLKKRHDLINTHTRFFITSFVGLIFAKVKRVPLLHKEHVAGHNAQLSKPIDLISRAYDHTLGALILKFAWKLIADSAGVRDFLRHLGVKETAKITVINDGVDAELFCRRETNLRKSLNLGKAVIITFVGRLIPAKGVQDVLSIFPDIKEKYGRVKLLIVGDGYYKQELQKLVKEEDKEDILFLGQKNSQEVAEILNITDIFVSPSYLDSSPYSLFEAGNIGIALVAADTPGIRDFVKDHEDGLLFSPGDIKALKDKICQLIEDDALRERLGGNAQAISKEMSNWDTIVDKWMKEMV